MSSNVSLLVSVSGETSRNRVNFLFTVCVCVCVCVSRSGLGGTLLQERPHRPTPALMVAVVTALPPQEGLPGAGPPRHPESSLNASV